MVGIGSTALAVATIRQTSLIWSSSVQASLVKARPGPEENEMSVFAEKGMEGRGKRERN